MALLSDEKLALLKQYKHNLNAKIHSPLGTIISYHVWWFIATLFHWPIAGLFLLCSVIGEMIVWFMGYSPVALNERGSLVVAISGCDTGFGRDAAVAMARDDGFVVVAGCLRSESVGELKAMGLPNLKPALLDVTNDASVAGFAKEVEAAVAEKQGRSLHCVINNAGVGSGGSVDWLKMENFKFDMEVNYFGMIRFTKACLPLLKAAAKRRFRSSSSSSTLPAPSVAPRIITVTSMAGLLPVPFLSPYNASKHAAEAFTACLRMELKSWGIKVSTCNPSFHTTPLVTNGHQALERTWKSVDPATKEEYGEGYYAYVAKNSHELMHRHCWDPRHVVDTLRSAVTLTRPRSQYLVGTDARFVLPLLRQLPSWVVEGLTLTAGFTLMPPVAAALRVGAGEGRAATPAPQGEPSADAAAEGEPKKDL